MAGAAAPWQRRGAMKTFFVLVLVTALAVGALFVPIAGKSFWQRAQERGIPAALARATAHGMRATWDFVTSMGHDALDTRTTQEGPQHSPRHPSRKAQAAAQQPARRPGREGIVPQPPKEKIEQTDRDALDSLVAHGR